jgi:predicted lipoprotein with Yx(FWY)xxD motif
MQLEMGRVLIKRIVGVPAMLIAIGLVAAACDGGAQSSTPQPATSPSGEATVTVAMNPTLGDILVDARGMTLYTFGADTAGMSNCTEACLENWPALAVASGDPLAGSGVAGTLGVITRSDGMKQVTLDGMPLYTFLRDTGPGEANGEGVTAFGGLWNVVKVGGTPATGDTRAPSPTPVPPLRFY